jgi:REP element-mobilizing transposase RayT
MGRPPRVHATGAFYNATLRGNHRQAIFRDDGDRERLDEVVAAAVERYDASLHAYCWMTNHVHLLVRVAEAPLGRVMQVMAARYARQFQRSIPTSGHLFERRYHAEVSTATATCWR